MSLRIVTPFRPLPLEAEHHREDPDFDWMDAIRMMSHSAELAMPDAEVRVITDADTALPMPSLQYATSRRRLMLWYLEICACYLASRDFDRDTIMLDADQLVYGDLRPLLSLPTELGILVRRTPKGAPGLPILNGVQIWPLRGRARLADFYNRALEIAEGLPEADIIWGADTIALERLLAPLDVGLHDREGLRVRLIKSDDVLHALSSVQIRHIGAGRMRRPAAAVLDFRNRRKRYMRPAFEQTIWKGVPA